MCRKLKNRWGSILHTVVRRIADDVPAYVIENEKGKRKVLHQVWLLLWSSAEEEEGLQMTATQLAKVKKGVECPTNGPLMDLA